MNSDEAPLHKIIWHRFMKRLGEPPPCDQNDTHVMLTQAIKRNGPSLFQAALIASAVTMVASPETIHLAETWKWLTTHLPGFSDHRVWYVALLLCTIAALTPGLLALLTRIPRYCTRTNWWPVPALLGLVSLWYSSSPSPEWKAPMPLGWALVFVAIALKLWKKPMPNEGVNDSLQRNYFVDRIMECFQSANGPVRRIAIFGGWGTGKTTLLKLLRRKLEASENPQYAVAMVNPWVVQDVEEFHTMLARSFEEALGSRTHFHFSLSIFRWLSSLTGIKVAGTAELTFNLKQLFRGGSSVQEDLLVQAINDTLRSSKRICVILVDDMERAEPEVIRRVFPLIDLLRRIENCYFVFGIDPARVAKAFREHRQGGDNTKGYLDKVFDLQINLPQARQKDLAQMCKGMVDKDKTPKLYHVWEDIAPCLPPSPREAIHFVRDATMRETLFLSRYSHDEHDYASFFKLQIIGIEAPGIINHIDAISIEQFRNKRSSSHFDIHKRAEEIKKESNQHLDTLWASLIKGTSISYPKRDRLKKLFSQVASSNLDIAWACHHHMRLLTLSHEQRLQLHETWSMKAGAVSILNMITATFPGLEFSDPEAIASTLIESELNKYISDRQKLLYTNSNLAAGAHLNNARQRLEKLVAHLQFAQVTDTEKSYYPNDYFSSWKNILFRGNLEQSIADTTELRLKEIEHSIAASTLLNLAETYHFTRFPTQTVIYQNSHGTNATHLTNHIYALRHSMQQNIYETLLNKIRSGEVAHRAFLDVFNIHHLSLIFGDLESWNPRSDDLLALRSLEDEIANNPNIATSMAAIARSLLDAVDTIVRNNDPNNELSARKTIQDSPDYTSLIWRMALRNLDESEDLIFHRNYYGKRISDSTLITTSQFDAAFPIQQDGGR